MRLISPCWKLFKYRDACITGVIFISVAAFCQRKVIKLDANFDIHVFIFPQMSVIQSEKILVSLVLTIEHTTIFRLHLHAGDCAPENWISFVWVVNSSFHHRREHMTVNFQYTMNLRHQTTLLMVLMWYFIRDVNKNRIKNIVYFPDTKSRLYLKAKKRLPHPWPPHSRNQTQNVELIITSNNTENMNICLQHVIKYYHHTIILSMLKLIL